jgi:hypothetical protein
LAESRRTATDLIGFRFWTEDATEHIVRKPFLVLLGKGRMPPIEQVELDANDIPFPAGHEVVFGGADGLKRDW